MLFRSPLNYHFLLHTILCGVALYVYALREVLWVQIYFSVSRIQETYIKPGVSLIRLQLVTSKSRSVPLYMKVPLAAGTRGTPKLHSEIHSSFPSVSSSGSAACVHVPSYVAPVATRVLTRQDDKTCMTGQKAKYQMTPGQYSVSVLT
jgi:hypothetical protein